MRARTRSGFPSRSRGLSLVEILVGVAIGLIGIVAIFQAVAVWTKHTQTTSSGGDAQVAGTLALFNIERDVKQAGHGFGRAPTPVMGCPVGATPLSPAFALRAVDIVPGAGGAPDQISILYGDSSFYVEQGRYTDATATTKKLQRRVGFKRGDVAIVATNPGALPGTATCELVQITDDSNVDGYTVGHTTAPFLSYYAPTAPAAASPFNVAASAPAFTSGTMYNLGPNPRLDVWSIQANRVLTRTDVLHATPPLQVGEGVINLKAEFGADANGNNVIDPGEWSAVAPADWRTLFAIRVAVLVRSRQFERNGDPGASGVRAVTPTAANPFYFGDRTRLFLMRNVDGTADSFGDAAADPNNWRYYRYRVYERVIPLRNMLWGNFG